jgi:hypothetical protein
MWDGSRCKMGSSDLSEFTASHLKNLYTRCSSADTEYPRLVCSVSLPIMC